MFDALLQAGEIVDGMFASGAGRRTFAICEENRAIIEELQAFCHTYAGVVNWTALGTVSGSTSYFVLYVIHSSEKAAGQVITVDFKARKVVSRQAA